MCLRCCMRAQSPPLPSAPPLQQEEDPPKAEVSNTPISKQPISMTMPSVSPSQIPPVPTSLPSQADETFQACPKSNTLISKQPIGMTMPSVSPSQELQIPPVPASLPSQADETFQACPKFRIVVIGNVESGVGKSTLVRNIFNIDRNKIDIRHDRAGEADIKYEYKSHENPRFILHDGKGFEPGSENNWKSVENFIQARQAISGLAEKIHAIWLCVETPRRGMRLFQTGDEKVLELARQFAIPIIIVFTKYDKLVDSFLSEDDLQNIEKAENDALNSFNNLVKEYQLQSQICVRMENGPKFRELLIDLTNVTRKKLQNVEQAWIAAQQINARQKVDHSISEGFKKYWQNLGQSIQFEDKILIDCVHRIHDDVLKVWNFNDPTKILSGTSFFVEMIGLVKPLIDKQVEGTSLQTPVLGLGTTGADVLVPLLRKGGLSLPATQYLYDKYQPYPSTAKFLATYIVHLVLVLHAIFTDILPSDPPRELSNNVVFNTLTRYKADPKMSHFADIESATEPEQVIDNVIKIQLSLSQEGR